LTHVILSELLYIFMLGIHLIPAGTTVLAM
jgi:hypothetical protein